MYNFCTYGDRRVKKLKNDSRNLWQMSKTPNTNGIADYSRNSVCLLFFFIAMSCRTGRKDWITATFLGRVCIFFGSTIIGR